jgi:O-antigen/teichoic acid export membrane protein
MLLMFMGLSVVGIYASAGKVAGVIALLVTVFKQAWSPIAIEALKKSQKERDEFYRSGFNFYLIAMFSLGALIVVFGKHIMEVVVPSEYWSGYVVIPWIIGAKVFHGAASFTGLGTVVSKRTGVNSIAAWSGAIVNLILGFSLVPVIGIKGAAIGSFVAELLFMLLLWRYTYRTVGIKFNVKLATAVILIYISISLLIII